MSEIDPMVHDLMKATRECQSYEDHGEGESERALFWEGNEEYLAQRLTARLAAAQPSREDIRAAIRSFKWLMIPPVTYWGKVDEFLDDFANHVMAVLSKAQGGEDGAPHVSGEHIADLDLEFEDGGEGRQLLVAQEPDTAGGEPMRQIVSTPDTLGGKWRLDGHRISVAQLKDMIRHDESEPGYIELGWPHLNLTAEERAAIKAWTFPAIHDAAMYALSDLEFICRCGEWVRYTTTCDDDASVSATCDCCGRRYTLTLTEVTGDEH